MLTIQVKTYLATVQLETVASDLLSTPFPLFIYTIVRLSTPLDVAEPVVAGTCGIFHSLAPGGTTLPVHVHRSAFRFQSFALGGVSDTAGGGFAQGSWMGVCGS